MELGFLMDHLGPSQLSYRMISQVNDYLDNNCSNDIIVFFENLSRPVLSPRFAIMQINEAWGFQGAAIATSLSTAGKLVNYPEPLLKIFYVWDLEWLRSKNYNYEQNVAIYRHPELKIVTRCEDYKKEVENLWNVKVHDVVKDFNIEQFIEISENG